MRERWRVQSLDRTERSAVSLQRSDYVIGGDSLAIRKLGVHRCIPENVFKKGAQDAPRLFVDPESAQRKNRELQRH